MTFARSLLLTAFLAAASFASAQGAIELWKHGSWPNSGDIDFSPDGRSVLKVDTYSVHVLDLQTGKLKAVFGRLPSADSRFKFLGGSRVLTWSKKGIWVYDLTTGIRSLVTTLYNGSSSPAIYPSPDSKYLAIGSGGDTAVFNLLTGNEISRLAESATPVWTPDSQNIAFVGPRIYKPDGTVVKKLTAPGFAERAYLRVLDDGSILQFLNSSQAIKRYTAKGVLSSTESCALANGNQQLYVSPDGKHLSYWGSNEVVFHQASTPFAIEGSIATPNYSPQTFRFSPYDGDFYIDARRVEGGISQGYSSILRHHVSFQPFQSSLVAVLGENQRLMSGPKDLMDDYLGFGPCVYSVNDYVKARPQWVRRLSDGEVVDAFSDSQIRYFSPDGVHVVQNEPITPNLYETVLRLTATRQRVSGLDGYLYAMGRSNRFLLGLSDGRFEVRQRKGLKLQSLLVGEKGTPKLNDTGSMVAYVAADGKSIKVQNVASGAIVGMVSVPFSSSSTSLLRNYWITKQGYLAIHADLGIAGDGGHRVVVYKFNAAGTPSVFRQFDQPGAEYISMSRITSATVSPDGEWVLMATNLPPTAFDADPAGNAITRLRYCRLTDGVVAAEEVRFDYGAAIKTMSFTYDSSKILLDLAYNSMMVITGRPVLKGMILDKAATDAGQTGTGSVTLSIPAGPGGTIVNLSSSKTFLTVPATVIVPAGERTATFPYSTSAVKKALAAGVVASYDGLSFTDRITVRP